MKKAQRERSLAEPVKHAEGRYGGNSFSGQNPDGVTVVNPLPAGTVFPNGATAALLLTFDVEGTYGNGIGDMEKEVAGYERFCRIIADAGLTATFMIVGKMAEELGPGFVETILDSGCEVATHGYHHELTDKYGGDKIYAGHYGLQENIEQVNDGVAALEAIRSGTVRGIRLPYGHFNEYSYDAIAQAGLNWASHVGIDDWVYPGVGYGGAPFTMRLGDTTYPIVEIPMDTQTYDWSIWIADRTANPFNVMSVENYCKAKGIHLSRTPAGAVEIWRSRMWDAIKAQTVFTFLAHPINSYVSSDKWTDAVSEFLVPVVETLAELSRSGQAWVCTCSQMADFYRTVMEDGIG